MTERLQTVLRYSLLALLVLWGGYTFLAYISVPVHQAVLMSDPSRQAVLNACGDNAFCTKWHSLLPTILDTFARANPFTWYLVWSVILYGILLGAGYLNTGKAHLRFTLSPLKLILISIGFLWLLFTVISTGVTADDQPYRRLYMPSSQVYPNADPQTISVLLNDYNDLKKRGCLTEVQSAAQGVEVSDAKVACIQGSFFTRVLTEVFCVLYVLFVLLCLGRFLLRRLRVPSVHPAIDPLLSIALGACGLIVILWCFAVAGIYTQTAGWIIMIGLPLLLWKQVLHWGKWLVQARWHYDAPWYGAGLFLGWLLLSYLLFNFLTVVRPFPIGWDDLGTYLNSPRLLVSYGMMIPRMSGFQWEYITSLGFLLFGFDSWFGATTSMMMNWMAGLLSVYAIYAFASHYLGRRHGLLSALLYYTLPMVGHFSFADMKIDNAVFLMSVLCIFTAFLALFPGDHHAPEDEHAAHLFSWKWIILAGIFGGFGFAIKPTMIMVILTVFAVLAGVLLQASAFVGAGFLAWLIFTYQGVFNISDFFQRLTGNGTAVSKTVFLSAFGIAGVAILAFAARMRPKNIRHAGLTCLVFLGVSGATILPWILHNNIVAGRVIPTLMLNEPNKITPEFLLDGSKPPEGAKNMRYLPEDLKIDFKDPDCTGSTSKSEELDRYWGYGTGISHYAGLPYRSVMNLDTAGYYVTTMPALLLFPLLLLLPYFWTKKGRWLRWLFVATLFLLFQWMFLANGILWYGIGMFLGLCIGLEALVAKAPDRSTKIAASVLLFLSLVCCFANRFWQFETQRNLYSYSFGLVSAYAMQERTIPHYSVIRDLVLQRAAETPDTPYVFRMGTFIPYFIPKNLEIIPVADNQMSMFMCLNSGRNPEKTVKRLKALGFNSLIFDTNTQTIERDPNGTLHKKVQTFLDFANTPGIGLQAVINDPDGGIAFILLP